jgi:hypothetical protein
VTFYTRYRIDYYISHIFFPLSIGWFIGAVPYAMVLLP